VTAAVLDTSVFIASESGRPLRRELLPDRGYITVITLAELEAGVLAATTVDARAARLATLTALADVDRFDVDAAATRQWARLRVRLSEAGRRANTNDLWIAAVAAAQGLPVVSQDGDFGVVASAGGPAVIRV